jgi:hypothetical protein
MRMTNLWTYKAEIPFAYGAEATYILAAQWLDGHGDVEDWGCGSGWARQFFTKSRYTGLDGSWSKFCDKQVELQEYTSSSDCILIRHVLDHNHNWRGVLQNAVASFKKRLAVVTFMPFSTETYSVHNEGSNTDQVAYGAGIPNFRFSYPELVSHFSQYLVKVEKSNDECVFLCQK